MGYILVWKNNDDFREENDFQNKNELVHRLLELSRLEYAEINNTEIVSLTKGALVDFEYRRGGKSEKLTISGKVESEIPVENANIPDPDMRCPVCGCDAGLTDEIVSVKSDNEKYHGMSLFVCSECERVFCT